jgi:hypothetical protein
MASSAKKALIPGGRTIFLRPPPRLKKVQRSWNGRRTESGRKANGKRRGNGSAEKAGDGKLVDGARVATTRAGEESTIADGVIVRWPLVWDRAGSLLVQHRSGPSSPNLKPGRIGEDATPSLRVRGSQPRGIWHAVAGARSGSVGGCTGGLSLEPALP